MKPKAGAGVRLKVLLTDNHDETVRLLFRALVRRGDIEVIGPTSNVRKAIELAAEYQPHLAVLDLPPSLDPINAVVEIGKISPQTRIILLTSYQQGRTVASALHRGVCSVILKSMALKELLRVVTEVSMGNAYVHSESFNESPEWSVATGDTHDPQLRGRGRQVLQLIAEGKTTKEIATILGISTKTAEFHRRKIMEKLEIHGTAGLVRYAIRSGLIQL